MHGALPEAVVELDPMRGGAAEKRCVEEIGATDASRHRDATG